MCRKRGGEDRDLLLARLGQKGAGCGQFQTEVKNQAIRYAVWRKGEVCELEVYIREALSWESGRKKDVWEGRRGRWK